MQPTDKEIAEAIRNLESAYIAGMDEEYRDDVRTLLDALAAFRTARQATPASASEAVRSLVQRWRTQKTGLSAAGCANELEHALASGEGQQGERLSPMAKMAEALRAKAAAERSEFDARVQAGEWGPMPEAGTQSEFCRACDGTGWDGESRVDVCPACNGGREKSTQQQAGQAAAWLSWDEACLALWQAIDAIKLGNKTDDKLILRNLRAAGLWIAASEASGGGSRSGDQVGTTVAETQENAHG